MTPATSDAGPLGKNFALISAACVLPMPGYVWEWPLPQTILNSKEKKFKDYMQRLMVNDFVGYLVLVLT